MKATVYLVGAGPGAADLLTVRAVRLLGEADIVFHDALVAPEILLLAAKATKVAVGKRCGRHSTVAPESSSTAGRCRVGITVASAGLSMPGSRPSVETAAITEAPVCPAENSAAACPSRTGTA